MEMLVGLPKYNFGTPWGFSNGKGFTIMEMLVVLVLAGLISTLLMQGLTHSLNLRVRFLSQLERQCKEALELHWFQEVCTALAPDHPSEEHIFFGDENHFQGLSHAPLKGYSGIPTRVTMELIHKAGHVLLQYQEGNSEVWEIGRWCANKGNFSYLDTQHQWHGQWPPRLRESAQLPEGILLDVDDVRDARTWFVGLSGRRDHKPRLTDLIGNF